MLTSQEEKDAVRDAWEPGIRDATRPRTHFENIMKRFFKHTDFNGKKILDLGPGHYDFVEMCEAKGASSLSLELDPAVIKLGHVKNLEVIEADLKDKAVYEAHKNAFDGLFCRGSINAGWFTNNPDEHRAYIEEMLSTVKEDGFVWIAPCNDPDKRYDMDAFHAAVNVQIEEFKKRGYTIMRINKWQKRQYGIWTTKPRLLYTKGLKHHTLPW